MATLTITGTAADDTIVITASGTDSGTYSINGGPAVEFSGVTRVVVTGEDGNDTLTIANPSGGLFAPMDGISYDGGGDPADALEVLGGTANDVTYTAGATPDAGTLTYTGEAGTQTIDFAGIAPVTDTVAAPSLTITGTAGADAITVADGGVVNTFQTTQVGAATFESIRFANKTTVTINGGGGADTLTFNNPNAAAGLTTLNVANVGAVTQTGVMIYTNLSLDVTGNVTLEDGGNDVTNLAASVSGAGSTFAFRDLDDIAIVGIGFVNGVSTNNGNLVISTANGPIIVTNTAAAADVNAGASTASLTAGSGATDFLIQLQPSANLTGLGGVQLMADNIDLATGATVNAGAATATLSGFNAGTLIDLGGADATNTLGLTDSELDGINAATLRIGSTSSFVNVTISSQISPNNIGTLALSTGGGIVDGTAGEQADITVANLALQAASGIGHLDPLDVAVSNLAFNNSGFSNVNINNAAGLTLAAVDGLASSSNVGGAAQVSTRGPLTAATNVTTSGVLDLFAHDTAAPGDNLTVLGGVTVQSTGDTVHLAGGDDVVVQAGATVQSAGTFFANVDADNAEGFFGGTATLNGTFVAPDTRIGGHFDNDTLNGTPLVDSLEGGLGADTMRGGAGNDTYLVDGGDVVIENAGEGTDTVRSTIHFALPANVENLTLLAGSGDLQGYGNALPNTITGNEGSNLLNGGAGADIMNGGDGNDVYIVDDAGDTATEIISAMGGNDSVFATAHFALSANLETLVLQGSADLQGYGNGLVNTLIGNTGNNLLDGGAGADAMTGDAGNDVYFVDNAGDTVIESAGQGTDAVFSSAHLALSANVETLVLQGGADLQGYGNGLVNTLIGNTGNNLLDGGTGADVMIGGDGNDVYFVDNAGDGVVESAGQGTDAVFASAHFALSANVETLVLQGSADLQGAGNNLVNKLFGNTGNNLLDGGTGADTMYGGIGNDTYFVDNGLDQVVENAGEGIDAVFSSAHLVLSANVETLVLQGGANANGAGNALANAIFGDSSDNMLDGQGNADTLTGNAGNDTFVFIIGQGNGDTVVDFAGNGTAAGDSLRFVGYGVGATFTNIDAAHWQVNYNGGASHEIITFMNGAPVHATDFVFV